MIFEASLVSRSSDFSFKFFLFFTFRLDVLYRPSTSGERCFDVDFWQLGEIIKLEFSYRRKISGLKVVHRRKEEKNKTGWYIPWTITPPRTLTIIKSMYTLHSQGLKTISLSTGSNPILLRSAPNRPNWKRFRAEIDPGTIVRASQGPAASEIAKIQPVYSYGRNRRDFPGRNPYNIRGQVHYSSDTTTYTVYDRSGCSASSARGYRDAGTDCGKANKAVIAAGVALITFSEFPSCSVGEVQKRTESANAIEINRKIVHPVR